MQRRADPLKKHFAGRRRALALAVAAESHCLRRASVLVFFSADWGCFLCSVFCVFGAEGPFRSRSSSGGEAVLAPLSAGVSRGLPPLGC